ncbi:DNA polymerase III subunit epsilon [Demequina sp. TTPB684]|uniref:exonuclease domain-containing protein n=1 Tax=unclassified Demequina TaxID=2620311 RepID=UPI001CF5A320|nr:MULTISPECIES: exonuclease domain-containing protein [unclassified Demequina]MCB2412924.1 DNA polymerase III subunit epsilon [Demequina sp. TTPB684]UPU88448.1 exonuclease domain-containing protein [Demequina sp. TMPB413]
MSWIDGPMVGFDTETTGVSPQNDRIVTAAVIRRHGGAVEVREWLINPGIEIPARATEVHGITTAKAQAEGANPADALEQIATALADALGAGIPVVGFNVQYDLTILEAELARHGLRTLAQRLPQGIRPIIDPLVLDRHLDTYRKGKRKLIDMCGTYRVQVVADDLHAADADVLATLDLVPAIAERYPSLATVALQDLHDQQASAHSAWANRFRAWLVSKGTVDDLPSPEWPVATLQVPSDDADAPALF